MKKKIYPFFCSLFKISRQVWLPGQCPEAPMCLPEPLLTMTRVWSPIIQGHKCSHTCLSAILCEHGLSYRESCFLRNGDEGLNMISKEKGRFYRWLPMKQCLSYKSAHSSAADSDPSSEMDLKTNIQSYWKVPSSCQNQVVSLWPVSVFNTQPSHFASALG